MAFASDGAWKASSWVSVSWVNNAWFEPAAGGGMGTQSPAFFGFCRFGRLG